MKSSGELNNLARFLRVVERHPGKRRKARDRHEADEAGRWRVCVQKSDYSTQCPEHYLVATWLKNLDMGPCSRWNIQLQNESEVKL